VINQCGLKEQFLQASFPSSELQHVTSAGISLLSACYSLFSFIQMNDVYESLNGRISALERLKEADAAKHVEATE